MGIQLGTGSAMSDINITPLVDVMLVLLIIFMVAAPVMERERAKRDIEENRDKQQRLVALNLPALDNSGKAPSNAKTLVLKVSNSLEVRLEDKIIADCSKAKNSADKRDWLPCFDSIEREMIAQEENTAGGVTIDAEATAPFGFVVGIMHRLYKAKIEKVSMFPRLQ
ncbi:MAG: biopolymer transporter ExbD [Bradymonadales bacterium]|jgi:biopolymer transport protein ExbD